MCQSCGSVGSRLPSKQSTSLHDSFVVILTLVVAIVIKILELVEGVVTRVGFNHDVDKVDKLQQEFKELKQILYTHVLQNFANNKNVEKCNRLISPISENLTTTTGFQNKKRHKTNIKPKIRQLYPTGEYNPLNMLVRAKIRQRL